MISSKQCLLLLGEAVIKSKICRIKKSDKPCNVCKILNIQISHGKINILILDYYKLGNAHSNSPLVN